MISWGIALLAHVGVSNKEGIYAVRFLLGLVRPSEPLTTIISLTDSPTVRSWYVPSCNFAAHILVQA